MIVTSEILDQYQILRGTAEIMRKNRATEPGSLETSILARLTHVLFCGVFAACSQAAVAQESKDQPTRMECGAAKEAHLELDESWEQLTVQHPSVLCSFRRRSGGFPTATVVWEGRASAAISSSEASRAAAIVQSYQRVGLTDTHIIETHTSTSGNHSTFFAVARYTTLGTPMMAIIVIVDGSTRTFTFTLLDTAENFPTSRRRLEEIARTFEVSEGSAPRSDASTPLSPAVWLGVVLGCIAALALVCVLWIRALRR